MNPADDDVVLVDADGRPTGSRARRTVHDTATPRHLAFSCWIQRDDAAVLITRRSLAKATWPGVWTNACCGHPRPSEPLDHCVRRRVDEELGIRLDDLTCVLPDFSYSATDASGMVENELCPVFRAVISDPDMITPDPDEVMDRVWTSPTDLIRAMAAAPYAFSPWATRQAHLLAPLLTADQHVESRMS